MTSQHRRQLDRIHETTATNRRFTSDQAAREGAALRGELGIDAQLLAMSEQGKALRLAGDEAGYQALRETAIKIHNSR